MYKPKTNSEMNIVGWKNINWRKVERYVFKLQKRIYAASRRGDVKLVRKLQKTLMRSWSNKALAVRKVTQDNRGKKTAGVDGVKSLSPEERMNLIGNLKITARSKPTRRVWIPKPGREEKRPLGIPTIYDRCLQTIVKSSLEPEWEALFEPNSFGFRPGRSCHDAVWSIKKAIQGKEKYVLDADIAKCFDRINHFSLLQKLNLRGKVRQQIKTWLKSGVIDKGVFTATSQGTPQGGCISPLLANIALHGLESMLNNFAKSLDMRNYKGNQISWQEKVRSLTFIRYADDFVVFHRDLYVIQRCQGLISEWLKGIGLELKPSKTRIAHTLVNSASKDIEAGFDFLGYHIQQFPCGKYVSGKKSNGEILGFKTLITPTKEATKEHQRNIKSIIRKHKSSPQTQLILELNPVIRGWCQYYEFSDAQTVKEFPKQDYLVFQKLRAWGKYRCKTLKDAEKRYYIKIGKRNWIFAAKEGNTNPLRLLLHSDYSSNTTKYVKVKGESSPYDGNLVYWSTRMGKNPDLPRRKAILLKQQKGKCKWCGYHFREGDILEEDHIVPTSLGGRDEYKNLQLLHGHCHDQKTALDLIEIRKNEISKSLKDLDKFYKKVNYLWVEDILSIIPKAKEVY
ncbi:group II intron reverse transcriptase/maturase [Calothrix sp. CCY 0018]|uniref:group II intron reverse transcriptase/maturase n=1 Tax=Calothrix sp. CCY 0018 TaxID=3103864 RepID=UPI0039C70AB8